mmetsp:Transcript_19810/g.67012  ORF Transcript_19810/g.67012 Transcript_19810/m.67012 type:complete len:236 (-) Transcript_19810:1395-2102(-)
MDTVATSSKSLQVSGRNRKVPLVKASAKANEIADKACGSQSPGRVAASAARSNKGASTLSFCKAVNTFATCRGSHASGFSERLAVAASTSAPRRGSPRDRSKLRPQRARRCSAVAKLTTVNVPEASVVASHNVKMSAAVAAAMRRLFNKTALSGLAFKRASSCMRQIMGLPPTEAPSMQPQTYVESDSSASSTKAKPLFRPVSLSRGIDTAVTSHTASKARRTSDKVVPLCNPFT